MRSVNQNPKQKRPKGQSTAHFVRTFLSQTLMIFIVIFALLFFFGCLFLVVQTNNLSLKDNVKQQSLSFSVVEQQTCPVTLTGYL